MKGWVNFVLNPVFTITYLYVCPVYTLVMSDMCIARVLSSTFLWGGGGGGGGGGRLCLKAL